MQRRAGAAASETTTKEQGRRAWRWLVGARESGDPPADFSSAGGAGSGPSGWEYVNMALHDACHRSPKQILQRGSVSVCNVRLDWGSVVMTFGAVNFTFPFLSVATTVWASCSLPSALMYST